MNIYEKYLFIPILDGYKFPFVTFTLEGKYQRILIKFTSKYPRKRIEGKKITIPLRGKDKHPKESRR